MCIRDSFNVALQNKRNNYSGGLYVLVAFGGSDFLNLTYQTIHAIKMCIRDRIILVL